jgi:Asp-tRNA(Asn)/Glu-tRNA(Gln) amidotransferase A subunit family amidase
MTHEDLSYASAADLSALIRSRQLSPVEIVQSTLARVERAQPVLNAFITVCAEEALAASREAESAVVRGDSLGPLHGIPFSVKDLVNTKGVRTTYGSKIFDNHVPRSTPQRLHVSRRRARSSSARRRRRSSDKKVSPMRRCSAALATRGARIAPVEVPAAAPR